MRRRTHRRVRIAGALAALIVLAWVGTVIAVTVLSFLAWVIWRLGRYLETDQEQNGNSKR